MFIYIPPWFLILFLAFALRHSAFGAAFAWLLPLGALVLGGALLLCLGLWLMIGLDTLLSHIRLPHSRVPPLVWGLGGFVLVCVVAACRS